MADSIGASIRMIKSMDMEFTLGQMVDNIRATGVEANSMD